jgi:hypothetical protein
LQRVASQPGGGLRGRDRQGLSEADFIEHKNIDIDYRWAEGHNDRFPSLQLIWLIARETFTTASCVSSGRASK